jgi:GH18 family chitinase
VAGLTRSSLRLTTSFREAIINKRDTFAAHIAKYVQDGIDIDLEYPGAADIMVGGQPIGKTTDGLHYLKFLIVMKKDLGRDKCLSQHQRLTGTSEHFQSIESLRPSIASST